MIPTGANCKYRSPRNDAAAQCDPQTNMQTIVQTLVSGSPASCQPTMSVQKPCRRQNKQRVPRATDDDDEMEAGGLEWFSYALRDTNTNCLRIRKYLRDSVHGLIG